MSLATARVYDEMIAAYGCDRSPQSASPISSDPYALLDALSRARRPSVAEALAFATHRASLRRVLTDLTASLARSDGGS